MDRVIQFLEANQYLSYTLNEALKNHSYMRVGGRADILFTPQNETELIETIKFLIKEAIPYKVIGNGSNILFSDDDYHGVIIKNKHALNDVIYEGEEISVGSSVQMIKLAYDTAKKGLSGLEFISGIPGTIGGGIYMNAGAYNKEMKDVVQTVTYLDPLGTVNTLDVSECEYRYRSSIFKEKLTNALILSTKIKLEQEDPETIMALINKRKKRRNQTQPLKYPSCGSVFKNPKGSHAYLYIDQVGLRGYRIGGAKFSDLHCNFIINDENASASDVRALIELAEKKVYEQCQLKLVREVEYFNW